MKKRFVQILSVILGMVFLLVSSIALADSSHFETNINSKFGSEADEIKVKKISHQIGTNLTLEVNLPELSHQDNDKQISINVGTLKAGEEKNYL
ncbi:MAG: hypothetical protein LBS33_07310, partial [Streptococcaceae bacterium]|nr:hypothetical protein [Streptococcaceae bacterium]